MISFKAYTQTLFEGGSIKGPNGEEADPISTKNRFETERDIKTSLADLHDSFHKETSKNLFGVRKKALQTGSAFSGSSSHIVNHTISDEELHKHKPTMGDVDTQVPKEHMSDLHKHMTPGKKFGKYTVVKVQKGGNEIHVLAKHENGQHHQIDFEGVEYHHEEPTKFETFAHSSHWEDTKHGIKGASHKQLLNAAGGETHKFSITHGLSPRTDDKKAPAVHGEKDPKEISKKLFGKEHPIDSFDDVAHGIAKHIDPSKHQAIVDKFAERGHPHAVERLKGILSGKKVDESMESGLTVRSPDDIGGIRHYMKYVKQYNHPSIHSDKAFNDYSNEYNLHPETRLKLKNKLSESINESLELPDLSPDEHKKLAVKHRDDYLDNHYNKGSTNTSAALKAKTLWHWHAMRGNKEINPGYFRDSDAFDNTRRKYLLSLKENYTSTDDRSKFGYTTAKKPKKTHTSDCEWRSGHDCSCNMKLTHATDCDWRKGHDCDCGLTESVDESKRELNVELQKIKTQLNNVSSAIRHNEHMNYGGPTAAIKRRMELQDQHDKIIQRLKSQYESIDESTVETHWLFGKAPKKGTMKYEIWKSKVNQEKGAKDFHVQDDMYGTAKIIHKQNESKQETHHAAVTLPMGTSPSSHVGHQDLVDEMLHHASAKHTHVSLSDKAEYLSHAKRKEIMQKQSPEGVNVHVIHGAGESIRAAYDKLPAGKKVLHLVGGEERQGMLDRLKQGLEDGKVKEMEGHKFDEVHVHNPKVTRRTTSNGEKTSGTNFRKALAAGDEKTIKDHLGVAYSSALSKHLQKGVKSGAIEINRK